MYMFHLYGNMLRIWTQRIEAHVELKEEVKHLKSMLEQQASQMAEQRAHYDNMMMQMLS